MFIAINIRKIILATLIVLLFVFPLYYSLIIFKPNLSPVSISEYTVVIDPGHGSIDTGTHYGDIYEKNINLTIARFLQKELDKLNITTIMTRNEDKLYRDSRREDIHHRPQIANEHNADIFISIHVNNFPSSQPSGSQIFYKPHSGKSKKLASYVKEELVKLRPQNDRSLVSGNYYVLNNVNCPAVLIETGFISNPDDRKKLTTPAYQKSMAKAIKDGIINYLQYEYNTPGPTPNEQNNEEKTSNSNIKTTSINLYYLTIKNSNISFMKKPFSNPAAAILNKEFSQLQYNEILAISALEQLKNPPETAIPVLSPAVKIRSLKIDNGTAIVDFSEEIKTNFRGGAGTELKLIESISKTLLTIPGIKEVKLLIEGKSDQTIGGHIILNKTFK